MGRIGRAVRRTIEEEIVGEGVRTGGDRHVQHHGADKRREHGESERAARMAASGRCRQRIGDERRRARCPPEQRQAQQQEYPGGRDGLGRAQRVSGPGAPEQHRLQRTQIEPDALTFSSATGRAWFRAAHRNQETPCTGANIASAALPGLRRALLVRIQRARKHRRRFGRVEPELQQDPLRCRSARPAFRCVVFCRRAGRPKIESIHAMRRQRTKIQQELLKLARRRGICGNPGRTKNIPRAGREDTLGDGETLNASRIVRCGGLQLVHPVAGVPGAREKRSGGFARARAGGPTDLRRSAAPLSGGQAHQQRPENRHTDSRGAARFADHTGESAYHCARGTERRRNQHDRPGTVRPFAAPPAERQRQPGGQ